MAMSIAEIDCGSLDGYVDRQDYCGSLDGYVDRRD